MHSSEEIMQKLRKYAEENRLSWVEIAKKLKVTPNTLCNWNKGRAISMHNQQMICEMISPPLRECSVAECSFRNSSDHLTCAMLKIWNSLSEQDRAFVYMRAAERCKKASEENKTEPKTLN